jgi:hypothetical protein
LAAAERRLLGVELSRLRRFHELHSKVLDTIGPIRGIGELMVYDTSLRIGARLELSPDFIYLHAGTRVGARELGLDGRLPFVRTTDVPVPLRRLRPHEIEDFMCIFKSQFLALNGRAD